MSETYSQIADTIATQIAKGELEVGDRLPPQRMFAFENEIAVSTASRVYQELRRRGLVAGEVGRGTFVTNRFSPLAPAMQEPSAAELDLEIVFRLAERSREQIRSSMVEGLHCDIARHGMAPPSLRGPATARDAFAHLMNTDGFKYHPDQLLFAGSGKEAIAAAFAAIAPRGGRVAVETLTYPFVISVARMLGIELVPIALDEEGMVPEHLVEKTALGLNGVYLQPTLHSPLVVTMGQKRRRDIANILKRHNLIAIEDRVYGFLRPTTPLAAYAPERVIQIDSLSKRLMPGLSLGVLSAPTHMLDDLGRSIMAGGWMASSFAMSLLPHWVEDGTVDAVQKTKRKEAETINRIAAKVLGPDLFRGAPDSLHGWITLPGPWRAASFVKAAAQLGIALAPGEAFAVRSGNAPAGVRIAFSAPDLATWKLAIKELKSLLDEQPERSFSPQSPNDGGRQ